MKHSSVLLIHIISGKKSSLDRSRFLSACENAIETPSLSALLMRTLQSEKAMMLVRFVALGKSHRAWSMSFGSSVGMGQHWVGVWVDLRNTHVG